MHPHLPFNTSNPILGPNLLPFGGEAYLVPAFFTAAQADQFFAEAMAMSVWHRVEKAAFGKPMPRETFWASEYAYEYSRHSHPAASWPASVARVRAAVVTVVPEPNAVLGNLYRDGRDSVAFHADDEPLFGTHPVITSVSFGAERRFVLRAKAAPSTRVELVLPHGSLLVMAGECQEVWEHSIPKVASKDGVGPRVNYTLRTVVTQ